DACRALLTSTGRSRTLPLPMAAHKQPRRSRAGEEIAVTHDENFDQIYRDHADRIYRFAQRMCGQAEDAKDLVQETFLNAYRGLKDFRGEAQLATWLYTIASRASIRMRRKRQGAPERELSLEEFIPTSEGEFQLQIPTDGLSPEEALANKELRAALRHAIQKLPRKYRLVLVLRDMEGLSAKEVGSIMSLNERAVKSRLHRARLFVRRELSARGMDVEDRAAGPTSVLNRR
ncbi:MAG: RNA polymerase sigma factor, partial [Nitrospiraceae bacterium]